jgi:hypothetical protein
VEGSQIRYVTVDRGYRYDARDTMRWIGRGRDVMCEKPHTSLKRLYLWSPEAYHTGKPTGGEVMGSAQAVNSVSVNLDLPIGATASN